MRGARLAAQCAPAVLGPALLAAIITTPTPAGSAPDAPTPAAPAPAVARPAAGPAQTVAEVRPYEVRWAGRLMAVMMMGDLTPKIQLQDVAKIPHLFAVGVLDHLTGEVIVVDGAATLTRIRHKKMVIDHTMLGGSPFLIYASAPGWKERPIPKDVTDAKALEEFVGKAAQEAGVDVESPFVFRVRGKVAKARIHVVDLETREKAHAANDPDAHSKALVPFEVVGTSVEMVGFWARNGQSVLTHQGSRSHLHLVTADGTSAGHVDGLELDGRAVLLLPGTAAAPAPAK